MLHSGGISAAHAAGASYTLSDDNNWPGALHPPDPRRDTAAPQPNESR